MKQILLILFLLIAFSSFGQSDTSRMNPNTYYYGFKYPRLYAWNQLTPPQDTTGSKWGLAQKGGFPYSGNASYWSRMLVLDTTVVQPNGYHLGNRSWLKIGNAYNGTSVNNPSNGTVIASAFFSDSLVDVRRSVMTGVNAQPVYTFTSDFFHNVSAGRFIASIGKNNTGYIGDGQNHSNLAGVVAAAVVQSGNTGNISSMRAYYANLHNRSTDTVNYAYYFTGETGSNAGEITYAAWLATDNMNKARNNIYLYINRGDWIHPNGDWWIWQNAADSFRAFLGVGDIFVGDTTDRGDARFQVAGKVSSTDKYSYSTNINGSLSGNDLMTVSYFDSLAVKLTGNQTVAGTKTFSSAAVFSTMTQGSVLFAGSSGTLTQDNSNLFWDDTNNRLGIGTATPQVAFHILGATNPMMRIESSGTTSGSSAQLRLQTDGGLNGSLVSTSSGAANTSLSTIPNFTYVQGLLAGGLGLFAANASGSLYFATGGNANANLRLKINSNGIINISAASAPTYADNAAALAGSLVAGDIYVTATGQLMRVY